MKMPTIVMPDSDQSARCLTVFPTVACTRFERGTVHFSFQPNFGTVSDADLTAAYVGCDEIAERYAEAFVDPVNVIAVQFLHDHRKRLEHEIAVRAAYDRGDVRIWYMFDDHTFERLPWQRPIDKIVREARAIAVENPYGMLCPVRIVGQDGNRLAEIVTTGVHAGQYGLPELETIRWGQTLVDYAEQREEQLR